MDVEICDACCKGDLALVKRLITHGISPWICDDQGPLQLSKGNTSLFR